MEHAVRDSLRHLWDGAQDTTAGPTPGNATNTSPADWRSPRILEIACGLTLGADPGTPRLATWRCGDPRSAVERAALAALVRPPCLVSFSGGRDSSIVLATATAVARREGLPLPIPTTYRFAGAPGSHEDQWQELVVRHLDLPDWERVPIVAELDAVGPVARSVLARHGLLWPFNAHFIVPILQRASAGSVLSGVGGDELFGSDIWSSARAVLTGRRKPRLAHLRSAGLALAPWPVQRRVVARRHQIRWPWLRPEIDEHINRQLAAWRAATPLRRDRAVAWWWRSRSRTVLAASLDLLAADADALAVHPFLDPGVVGATARRFGARGPLDRSHAVRALFADLLPEAILARRSKAFFDQVFFSDHSRAFAASWSGTGIDASIVDAERLARGWREEHPDPRSFLILQSAWLTGYRIASGDQEDDGQPGPAGSRAHED